MPGASQQIRAAVLSDFPSFADAPPVVVTDMVLFTWARYPQLLKLFPVMNEVRALERRIAANECKSCTKPPEIDRSALNRAKIALAECSDDIALLVKRAVGAVKYKITYQRLLEPLKEVVR